jgi:hypothetical protein
MEVVVNATPCRFIPGKETRYPLNRRLGGPQGRSGRVQRISLLTRIPSPDRPARSESLYRLSYAGPQRLKRTNYTHTHTHTHIYIYIYTYEGCSKIFRTDAVKIIKLIIRPIGCRHPRSSSLPHVYIYMFCNLMWVQHMVLRTQETHVDESTVFENWLLRRICDSEG